MHTALLRTEGWVALQAAMSFKNRVELVLNCFHSITFIDFIRNSNNWPLNIFIFSVHYVGHGRLLHDL